jgi:hypothetical protein
VGGIENQNNYIKILGYQLQELKKGLEVILNFNLELNGGRKFFLFFELPLQLFHQSLAQF